MTNCSLPDDGVAEALLGFVALGAWAESGMGPFSGIEAHQKRSGPLSQAAARGEEADDLRTRYVEPRLRRKVHPPG